MRLLRHTTFLSMLLAIGLGLSVFIVKNKVNKLEQDLLVLERGVDGDQQAIHVLKAEWSHLNDPKRLRRLAEKHLGLVPVENEQVIAASSIEISIPNRVIKFSPDMITPISESLNATMATQGDLQ